MRHLLLVFLAGGAMVLSSGAAYASPGDPLFKLLPGDGAANDFFGWSVAISGTTAIVGSPGDDDNGDFSGSAYLFNTVTGQQIAKLLPDDGAVDDFFGWSVAISGTTAIVGARGDDDNGGDSGSAYLFDISDPANWTQIAKLLASDGEAGDFFGFSVAIRGATAIVGAPVFSLMPGLGSAYLFDNAGQQTAKILPDDGVAGAAFGFSVAISSATAIVGALGDDDNGVNSGSAYLFDISCPANPKQIAKLRADEGRRGDNFGGSVAISGTTAIVTAIGDDDNGSGSGSAYLFNTTTGQQIAKLLANDGAEGDNLGASVAISGATAIVGARGDDDNGDFSGSAYLFDVGGGDADSDGLLDDWETNGIPYTDEGGIERRFMLPGADPLHKDLYVEVDAMTGLSLSDNAVMKLVEAFQNAPLSNPDGITGITLHVFRDETNLLHVAIWQTAPPELCWPADFDAWRSAYYGTPDRSGNPGEQDNTALLEAKAKAYRYCIVADTAGPKAIGGCGEMPGDNFVIFVNGLNDEDQATVFMHELGHNLSLDHGGGDGVNGKPNYPSIMNYVLSYRYPWNTTFWELDYSRADADIFESLDESFLNERLGVGTVGGYYKDFRMPFGVNVDSGANTIRDIRYIRLDGSTGEEEFGLCQDPSTDFGNTAGTMFQDCFWNVGVEQDLNYFGNAPSELGIPSTDPSFSPPQTLVPYDDWANVSLPLAAALGDLAPAIGYPTDELTSQAREWINENFPLPPDVCLADLDGNGQSDLADFSVFHGCISGPGHPFALDCELKDIDVDGDADLADFAIFQASFGCP